MTSLNFEHTQSQRAQQKFALMARLEQANVLEMSEGEFHRLVAKIESSDLFKKLYRDDKIIRYLRFPKTDLASNFLELREETVADEGSLDVESLLLNKEHIVHLIQKIGLEKFKRYFLFNEPDVDMSDIARECDLDISEIQQINSLINEFSVLSEFYNPAVSRAEQGTAIHTCLWVRPERGLRGLHSECRRLCAEEPDEQPRSRAVALLVTRWQEDCFLIRRRWRL